MISSGGEVFKREGYGKVGGKRKARDIYIVKEAFPFQTADRRYGSVYYDASKREKRMENIIRECGLNPIGDYHSHPDNNEQRASLDLGFDDEEYLKENPNLISFIVAIKETQKLGAWNSHYDQIECFFKNGIKPRGYKISIAGYYYDINTKKCLRVKIAPCPELNALFLSKNHD